jgi:hypothetical protein
MVDFTWKVALALVLEFYGAQVHDARKQVCFIHKILDFLLFSNFFYTLFCMN